MPANCRRGRPQGQCHRKQTTSMRTSETSDVRFRCGRRSTGVRSRDGDLSRGSIEARVKRWGKSPPRTRQRGRQGKPHREQDRIGAARARKSSGLFRTSRPGWLREASSNGRPRRMAATWAKARHTEPGLQADWHLLLLRSTRPAGHIRRPIVDESFIVNDRLTLPSLEWGPRRWAFASPAATGRRAPE